MDTHNKGNAEEPIKQQGKEVPTETGLRIYKEILDDPSPEAINRRHALDVKSREEMLSGRKGR